MKRYREIQDKLKADLDEIVARSEVIRSAMREHDPAGNLSFEEFAAEGEFDEVLDSLGDRSRSELLDVWNALQRIERGTYGTCAECDESIAFERLEALPATEYCIDCATKLEQAIRRR